MFDGKYWEAERLTEQRMLGLRLDFGMHTYQTLGDLNFNFRYDQEKAEVGWYREFGDVRRGKEIPAAEQLWRMKTARQWIEYQFGVTPLQFLHGGSGVSKSYVNNTIRLAGQAGFGWYGFSSSLEGGGYLGTDMAIANWDFSGSLDSPKFEIAPPDGHDFGITFAPKAFAKIFEK